MGFETLHFAMSDILRRAQGDALALYGLGPSECSYHVAASGKQWRLRAYGGDGAARSLLVIAAPIKRPYIWDLAPSVSAVRYCLQQGLNVHLLEWSAASDSAGNTGLDECVDAIATCVAKISGNDADARPFLIGHSLGGTLAAIFAAWAPERLSGLMLLCAPLCFKPGESRFCDALVSLVPTNLAEADPFPGSLLSHMSALASPDTFVWSRLMDAALSLADSHAMEIHARVERWALDEVPLPGKLVHQLIESLYRENRFCRGALSLHGRPVGPQNISVPTLAVVNTADEVAPPVSIRSFIEALSTKDARVIEYPGEMGVALQHLGVLIGREAQAQVWPQIISWLHSRYRQQSQLGAAARAVSTR
jgi:polyhydroxyalkanoate synthase